MQRGIHEKRGRGVNRHARVRVQCEKRLSANRAGPHRIGRYRVRRYRPHGDARKQVVPAPRKKLPARASEIVKPISYFSLLTNH